MAKKFSALPAATTFEDADIIAIVQGGTTKQLSGSNLTSTMNYLPSGTGAVVTNVQTKLRESVSVKDFGAVGNGVTDDTAAIQAAITAGYAASSLGFSLYFPTGSYLMSSTITIGNTAPTCAIPILLYGDGESSVIKVTAVNVNPFLFKGPNPDVDGAGNRTGGYTVEKLKFTGPGIDASKTNSIALNFYGVQGITLRDLFMTGWWACEKYINVDLVNRYNVRLQSNYNGIYSVLSTVGGTYNTDGQMNNFNTYGGRINNHTNVGITYIGGISPCFYGVNFTVNYNSLVLSPNDASGTPVTTGVVISGCYFEGDTNTTVIVGGGTGTVRGLLWDGGEILNSYNGPAITIANYSDSTYGPGRGHINTNITNSGGGSNITQASSAEKIDINNINNISIGDITAAPAKFTTLQTSSTVNFNAGASVGALPVTSAEGFTGDKQPSVTSSGTAVGFFSNASFFVVRANGFAGTALVLVDTNFGASIVAQSAANFVTGAPAAGEIQVSTGAADGSGRKQLVLTCNAANTPTSASIVQLGLI